MFHLEIGLNSKFTKTRLAINCYNFFTGNPDLLCDKCSVGIFKQKFHLHHYFQDFNPIVIGKK